MPNQFYGGNNQGQVVVDVVAHSRELTVKFIELRHTQSDWFTRQTHLGNYNAPNREFNASRFAVRGFGQERKGEV